MEDDILESESDVEIDSSGGEDASSDEEDKPYHVIYPDTLISPGRTVVVGARWDGKALAPGIDYFEERLEELGGSTESYSGMQEPDRLIAFFKPDHAILARDIYKLLYQLGATKTVVLWEETVTKYADTSIWPWSDSKDMAEVVGTITKILLVTGIAVVGVVTVYKLVQLIKKKPEIREPRHKVYRLIEDGAGEPGGVGYTDIYRVDPATGKTRRAKVPPDARPPAIKVKGEYPQVKTDRAQSGKLGAALFTQTRKCRAPSWSVPAGVACPVVRNPIAQALRERPDASDKELIDALLRDAPAKCLSCYATTGNYMYGETALAQASRMMWFSQTPDDEVVSTLVDGILHAGYQRCDHKTKGCEFIPNVPPKYFRLFDSGDFASARDAKIWYRVFTHPDIIKAGIRFWVPTTAHEVCPQHKPPDHGEMIRVIQKMGTLPNVVVRPSSSRVNTLAQRLPGFGPGTVVVTSLKKEKGKRVGERQRNWIELCDSKGHCENHWICPGDCTVCRKCWSDTHPVAYILHGKSMKPETHRATADLFVRRFRGKMPPGRMKKYKLFKQAVRNISRALQNYVVTTSDIGPTRSRTRRRRKR